MQVAKWGNSLAVRLPVSLVKALNITEGDELQLQPAHQATADQTAAVLVTREASKLEQLHEARRFRAAWPVDFSFDREEANAR
jgi:antitoxin MazE